MQSNKPYCFKCEKGHRLSDFEDFKALPIGEKIQFCMRRRLCFNCFSCKHSVRECPNSRPCKHTDCQYTHHPLLHDSEKLPVKTAHPSTARAEKEHRVALGMLRLRVQGSDGGWCWANIFADDESNTTLVRSAFAVSLKIRGSPQVLTVDGAGGVVTRYPSELIHFQLRAESGEIITFEGSTMKKVASPAPTTNWSKEKMRWPHLRDLPVGEVGGKVDILIGTDHLHLLAARESREGDDYEPIASRTRLGWIIRGVTNRETHALAVRSFIISGRTQLDQLTSEMRRFCDTEAFGTEFKQGCRQSESYGTGEGEDTKISCRAMAVNRFQSLLRRFQHEPELERDYEAAMQKTLDQGYASRVEDPADAKYFLAHHGVYKGTKLRVVFDAAAPFRGKALNDVIIGGPALQPALAAVIIRFRQEECAWASDIEAMFSHLRLSAEVAKFFCFLLRNKSSGDMVTYKMDRLPFGASCSPFVAIHTIQRMAEDAGVEEKVAVAVRERMYVDDYLSSTPTVQEAVQEASAVRNMLADADLNLQRWVSNSPDLLQQMTVSTGPSSSNIHPLGSSSEEKVLGVFWDIHSDTLGFKVAETPDVKFTKMELASRVAGVFDPLGTASPIIVKAKIRLRMLGQSGLQWTDVVGEEDTSWWLLWFKELQCLNQVAMPRCLFPNRETLGSSRPSMDEDQGRDWSKVQITLRDIPQLCALEKKFLSLVRQCQEESFAEELNRLRKKKALISTSSLLALAPIMSEDGLLRLGGRAGRARLPYNQLHPPFLPGRHPFTEKIVVAFHQSLNHVGTDFLLSYIRQHFWVTKGREVVKKIRRDSVICRRNRAQPGEQIMADLTESRLDFGSIPFTRAAVDLFGPLEIGLYRNKTTKRWSVLYTCLVTRAVFLELVPSLSSTDFLLSLRKFVAMYRSPEVASDELPKYLQASHIKWTFQPPRTPHFGGDHESLVKSTKRALYNALEQEKRDFRYPTEDLLRTLLYEVAGLLNTRPLTYARSDPSDFRPLTPNDFLNRAPTAYPPAGLYSEAQPRDHYRYLQRALNLFWDIWKTVYLQSLAARKKWQTRRPNLEIRDIVLEINKGFERGVWSIGHVVQVFPGSDGCVRAVDVRLPSGIFRRGITELCLLENNSAVPASGEDVPAKSQ
ncbi:Uncharacterized protein APZ42_015704 [Daphnia magna]|uniref:Integrase catalytic domain-containing protein n=1 Tax=Daphnia magna TaxID=35525 RepID=A0A162NQN9_9CRUS|nr:Uncharacterized protein APZ42_015704 [Daphnia magna]